MRVRSRTSDRRHLARSQVAASHRLDRSPPPLAFIGLPAVRSPCMARRGDGPGPAVLPPALRSGGALRVRVSAACGFGGLVCTGARSSRRVRSESTRHCAARVLDRDVPSDEHVRLRLYWSGRFPSCMYICMWTRMQCRKGKRKGRAHTHLLG